MTDGRHVPGVSPVIKLDAPKGLYRATCSCRWISDGVEPWSSAMKSALQHANTLNEREKDREVWIGPATDNTWGAQQGQTVLTNVHPESACAGTHCVLHNPSDHHMVTWPTVWRGDQGMMERICPHGVGHPDPDDMAYHASQGREHLGIHGCDGCCWTSDPPET